MYRGTISKTVILAILSGSLLSGSLQFLAKSVSAQSPGLSQEVLNRPLRPCSSPPGCDSNVKGMLWVGGVVPYVFDTLVTAAQQAAMIAAMKEWENVSPVRFVPRTNQNDYIHIKGDGSNWSNVGKIGGKQGIGIYNWNSRFQMAHELCHALGFMHEHQRPDRDIFVTIAPSKLADPQFQIKSDAIATSSYDFDSVMHGDSTAITVNGHHNKIWQSRIGQRDHLSTGDIRGMQVAYGEPNRPPSEYGFASTSTDFVPTFHTQGEFTCTGNSNSRLVSRNLTGGATGLIILSTEKASFDLLGSRIYVVMTGTIFSSWFPLPTTANGPSGVPGAGVVTLPIAIPDEPSLLGRNMFLQGAFLEPGFKYGTTAGMWLTFHNKISKNVTCLYDHKTYQQHVTSAQVGQAVWNANRVAVFSYVKTQQFICGGETHWIVIVKHQQTDMEFCLIPGGSFRMGDSNETPVHWVHLEPFLLSRTEVTQGMFYTVMGSEPWKGKMYVKDGPDYAANYIDWYDASAFCARLGMRLPTESEWEYACRAGTTTCYHFGENWPPTSLGNYAWFRENAWNVNQRYAHQVGLKLPNAFGLHDMHGNVFEWCIDLWHDDYNGASTNGRSWDGSGSVRVFRGGCWHLGEGCCSSAFRSGYGPDYHSSGIGFRVARPLR